MNSIIIALILFSQIPTPALHFNPAEDFEVRVTTWQKSVPTEAALLPDPFSGTHTWVGRLSEPQNFVADISEVYPSLGLNSIKFTLDLSTLTFSGWFRIVEVRYRLRVTIETDEEVGEWSEPCKYFIFRVFGLSAAVKTG